MKEGREQSMIYGRINLDAFERREIESHARVSIVKEDEERDRLTKAIRSR